ncbi:MAG: hypothetical protein KJ771_01280, partial [Nanoarchaeota archaeon]|nr:hypothetical protein [Nanoarchaeota archaeon]
ELGEEIIEVKKKEYLKENVKIFQVYDLMSSTEKEKGPLTALVQAGLVPSFTSEYLLMLIKENIKGYELLLAHKDMDVHTKNIFCLYADDKVPVDKVVSLGQVNLINLDENTFLKELYAGEVNFNDLVLDGIELQDKERFQELKEEYLKHRFSNEQVKGIKLRALELSNQAQTHYNRAVQTELNLQRIPLVQRKGELVERLNRVRMELSFASLGNCREALRYLSFHGRYSVNNKPHFTTWQILQEPKNAIEITLTRCLDSYNQLKATPNELSSERVFKTIYLVRQALLEDDHVFTKEDTKPKEEQGSENKVSKLTIADLFATQPKENKK